VNYHPNLPIYLQIMQELKTRMASGELSKGERLLSVREFAAAFSVNPNTMQKALTELERERLVYSERTAGRFVTTDQREIDKAREQMANEYLQSFFGRMRAIGYDKAGIIGMLEKFSQEGQGLE
jgi:DNA-binding transcriptional regulator YhcF (GntR family)